MPYFYLFILSKYLSQREGISVVLPSSHSASFPMLLLHSNLILNNKFRDELYRDKNKGQPQFFIGWSSQSFNTVELVILSR
jgi:hypothetical protein